MIELVSDLAGGKTTFVSGIARGISSTDLVSSPTFTLSNVYKGSELTIHHYDFYRLGEAGIMGDELAETLDDEKAVTIVEWAGIVNDVLPAERLTIRIDVTGEESRHYTMTASGGMIKLLKELEHANPDF